MSHHPTDSDLGTFLRSRRQRVTPSQVGMPSGPGARRTSGLRREEVASLAGVSVDYYARLERGRERNPSPAVLNSLAVAFGLTPDECRYLYALAGQSPTVPDSTFPQPLPRVLRDDQVVRRSVLKVLEAIRPSPGFVTNLAMDVVAANPAGLALFPGLERHPPVGRTPEHSLGNISRYMFTDPMSKSLAQNWEQEMGAHVAHLRSQLAVYPDARDLRRLIDGLLADSPDFARLWKEYEVRRRTGGSRSFSHPVVGELHLEYESLPLADTPGHRLILYPTVLGTPEHAAVTLLDSQGPAGSTSSAVFSSQERSGPSAPRL
ncbi:helix-turn-helix domain-containing protein [Catenulispora sp. NF23]|uniref:Helix-turn-helix domain-containing protein n=1 Tax=Catenulispora pinistramenti TaxID=2705254 RepID=A0ABS5L5W9_9ACTN|nr:helix-turn-helix transcriptional regulator [Catenulispora pinistramenti]MBS2537845.1 helix-turn-helix domain-containing protein [Catenulispora pinistramenti]MBS2553515.1 helix-turn-helix domain-containing protein [Catenulispora pinistramenti]